DEATPPPAQPGTLAERRDLIDTLQVMLGRLQGLNRGQQPLLQEPGRAGVGLGQFQAQETDHEADQARPHSSTRLWTATPAALRLAGSSHGAGPRSSRGGVSSSAGGSFLMTRASP